MLCRLAVSAFAVILFSIPARAAFHAEAVLPTSLPLNPSPGVLKPIRVVPTVSAPLLSLPLSPQLIGALKPENQANPALILQTQRLAFPAQAESARAGDRDATLATLKTMDRILDDIAVPELSGGAGLAGALGRLWDHATAASSMETPAPKLSHPLEGIELFRDIDAETRLFYEEGTIGRAGYRMGQYWPRTGEFQLLQTVRGAKGNIFDRVTHFDANSGMAGLGKGAPSESDWRRIKRDIGWVARKLNLSQPQFRKPLNYPKLRRTLARIKSAPPIPAQEIKTGDFILIEDDGITAAQVTSVKSEPSFGTSFFSLGSSAFRGRGLVFSRTYMGTYYIREAGDNRTGYIGTLAEGSDAKAWRLSRADAELLADFRPRQSDPTAGTGMTRARLTLLVALTALQYERWFVDEIEMETRGSKSAQQRQLTGHYAGATQRNYRRALAILIARFGEKEFYAAAKAMFSAHLSSLHTKVHTPDSPYGPHSDTKPLPVAYTKMASDAILGVHPVPEDMSRSGYIVNVKSLFGDADFWSFLRDEHSRVFQRLVDLMLALPRPFPLRSLYAASTADPIGVVKIYFPKTFASIHAARPDFDSDSEPITLFKRP